MNMNRRLRDFALLRGPVNSTVGANNPRAKLTAQQVESMRREHAEGGKTLRELAEQYRVHVSTVHRVVTKAGWTA